MSATREKPAVKDAEKTSERIYLVWVEDNNDLKYVGIGRGANDIDAIRDATAPMTAAERSRSFVAWPKSRFNARSRRVEKVERESWS